MIIILFICFIYHFYFSFILVFSSFCGYIGFKYSTRVSQFSAVVFLPQPLFLLMPDRVALLVARLTQEPEAPGSIPGPATFFSFLLPR